ncbi:MAG: hypothetical protein KAG14_03535 [Mycoplasmataceae bacterium]|nr:hypothetical protein [Mycoplasmataceae bacterium]
MKKIVFIPLFLMVVISLSTFWWPIEGNIRNNIFDLRSYDVPFQIDKSILEGINIIFYMLISTIAISIITICTLLITFVFNKKKKLQNILIIIESSLAISSFIISMILWILLKVDYNFM